MWKELEKLAEGVQDLVFEPLQPSLQELIGQMQREQRRLQPVEGTRQVPFVQLSRQTGRRWDEAYVTLTTACALTRHSALDAAQQRLTRLEAQLSKLHRQMHEALGDQPVFSTLTMPATVGATV
jgi:hypothetical protein